MISFFLFINIYENSLAFEPKKAYKMNSHNRLTYLWLQSIKLKRKIGNKICRFCNEKKGREKIKNYDQNEI